MSEQPTTLTPEREQTPEGSAAEATKLWYRRLGPNSKISEVPLDEHIDAIASSVLDLLNEDVPDTTGQRIESALALTTDLRRVGEVLTLSGDRALPVIDLIMELSERDDPRVPGTIIAKLLNLADTAARGIRENPTLAMGSRFDANAKLSNVKLEGLRRFGGREGQSYSEQYITAVRLEAKWFADNALRKGGPKNETVGAGDLFELYVTCLSRQQMWVAELDESIFVRHATIREDQPTKNADSGAEGKYAHDVHAFTKTGATELIQCKWGPGAPEQASLYDPALLVLIETADDGHFASNELFKAAFEAIADSEKIRNADICDANMARYPELSRRLNDLQHKIPRAAGSAAVRNM